MVFLDGHYFLVFDGKGYFSSMMIHCVLCLHKGYRNGVIMY